MTFLLAFSSACESELFTFKHLHIKDERHLFHQKDLTVLVLIPHLNRAGFKFPTYRQGQQSNTHGLLVGVGGGVC